MQDSRTEDRYSFPGTESLDIYQHGSEFTLLIGREHCEIHNVSKHGLMISCNKALTKRDKFRLRFHLDSGTELTLFGIVRWIVKVDDRFLAGLWLQDTLGTDYLLWQNRLSRLLLDQLRPPASAVAQTHAANYRGDREPDRLDVSSGKAATTTVNDAV